MLYLTFFCRDNEYGINSAEIKEIIPLVKIFPLPKPSTKFIGYINYRGEPVPVMDLCVFLGFLPAKRLLSTRIIIINFLDAEDKEFLFAVLAENATDLQEFNEDDIIKPEIDVVKNPLLNKMVMKNGRTIYLLSFASLKTLKLEP